MILLDFLKTYAAELAIVSSALDILALASSAALIWGAYRAFKRISVKSLVRNLPGPKSASWFADRKPPEIYDVLNFRWHHEATRKYEGIFQIKGMFGDEQLYITDSRAMHHVLVKEQAIFEEPQSLLKQRKALNPFFTANHMRGLVPIFWPITKKLVSVFDVKLAAGAPEQEINVHGWAGRTALEFIAQGGFGTSLDSMVDGETGSFTKLAKEMVPTLSRMHVAMQLLPLAQPLFTRLPAPLRNFLLDYSPFPSVRKLKTIADSLEATSRAVLESKKAEVLAQIDDAKGERGRDILSVLLRAQLEGPADERLPDGEVIGHITTLIFAAQDTTSSAIARILQMLALHPAAQDRLRKEIRRARCPGSDVDCNTEEEESRKQEWEYDALMRLPYLDAIARETLRLHSPVSWIWRIARQPTTLPLRHALNGTDGRPIDVIPVAKNQGVVIGIAAANRDESVWGADAWEWKPERWLDGAGQAVDADVEDRGAMRGEIERKPGVMDPEVRYPGVYSGMMTFSGGGRSCIGFKFALLSLKLIVAGLVEKFAFAPPEEEIVWNMNHIAAPAVKGREGEGAQMPLKVSIAT
ncbi:cytochrome P450 [Phellopilus nigrolimitatus]|nr:cytochrome P450 [Phellopilus nigrolimitatus]